MTLTDASPVYFDPFNQDIKASPYAVYRRLRDEQPLYYNEEHDFYAVSRFDDVMRFFVDKKAFISSKGMVIDMIKQGVVSPPGLFVNEDPPQHTRHRAAVSILFTPGHIASLESKVRELCVCGPSARSPGRAASTSCVRWRSNSQCTSWACSSESPKRNARRSGTSSRATCRPPTTSKSPRWA